MSSSVTSSASSTFRVGALCGALSGLLIALPGLVEAFTGETSATSVPLALAPAFALPLLTALHLRQQLAAGSLGKIAATVNLIGLGLFGGAAFASNLVLFYLDEDVVDETLTGPTIPALSGSAAVFAVGCALFGAAMIRAQVFPKVPSWGYAVVLPLFAFLTALPDSLLTSALHVLVGAILIWLSAALWRTAPAVEHTTDPNRIPV
ncbi:hypothetical protein [Streptomyces sp. NL15-2K]|uniref:hypothetical protein n=1 Tax=Streptomyces sp. NL15-2K TaxID=376149 RepID=UPI000F57482F|nr:MULTISPECIES: hypothetical protein [Actinomycetes]WKX15844.1 hypothetical protein Q4V64_53490 [Kutzneria buriramensis]GCB47481.1 hypothetical protein SNL152K_4786 [Streptomyces sp. NL15-2K]